MQKRNDDSVVVDACDSRALISKLYKRFNDLIVTIRPYGNCNPVAIHRDDVNKAVNDLEILLDEVRELVR